MNDAFLPGNGFDTYEEQDRVLMGLSGSVRSGVAVRILQQQGFAVAAAVVRLADTPEEHAAVDAAKALAKKLDVECVTLNAEALAGQDAEAARFAALLTAADKLGIQYIASGRYARIETDAQGVSHCWVSVKQFSKNDTATACQDWLRSTRLGRGSIKSHVRTVKVLGMGLFAFQERVHLWKGVTH